MNKGVALKRKYTNNPPAIPSWVSTFSRRHGYVEHAVTGHTEDGYIYYLCQAGGPFKSFPEHIGEKCRKCERILKRIMERHDA